MRGRGWYSSVFVSPTALEASAGPETLCNSWARVEYNLPLLDRRSFLPGGGPSVRVPRVTVTVVAIVADAEVAARGGGETGSAR